MPLRFFLLDELRDAQFDEPRFADTHRSVQRGGLWKRQHDGLIVSRIKVLVHAVDIRQALLPGGKVEGLFRQGRSGCGNAPSQTPISGIAGVCDLSAPLVSAGTD